MLTPQILPEHVGEKDLFSKPSSHQILTKSTPFLLKEITLAQI